MRPNWSSKLPVYGFILRWYYGIRYRRNGLCIHALAQYAHNAPASIVKELPTAIYTALPAEMIPGVALKIVFLVGAPIAGLAILSANISDLKIEKTKPEGKKAEAVEANAEKSGENV